MKHFVIDKDYTLRTDSDYSSTQILKWENNEVSEVYSNNGIFTFPSVLEETDELPANIEIGKINHNDFTMFYYNGALIFPNCSKDVKIVLTLKWIEQRFTAKLCADEDNEYSIEFKDAKFVFNVTNKCTLISATGDYHKYIDYLYYRLSFTHQK